MQCWERNALRTACSSWEHARSDQPQMGLGTQRCAFRQAAQSVWAHRGHHPMRAMFRVTPHSTHSMLKAFSSASPRREWSSSPLAKAPRLFGIVGAFQFHLHVQITPSLLRTTNSSSLFHRCSWSAPNPDDSGIITSLRGRACRITSATAEHGLEPISHSGGDNELDMMTVR